VTIPVSIDPAAKEGTESERQSKMRRRGLFAAAAALFAGLVARPKEVVATAGGGPDGNMVLGSNFITGNNTANQITVLTPGSGTWLASTPVLFDAEANTGVGVPNMTGLYGHAKGTGTGVMGVSSGGGTGHHGSDLPNTGVIGYGVGARIGVAGFSDTSWAVLGNAGTGGVGVFGISPYAATVGLGQGSTAIGVWGQTDGAAGYGVYGNATTAGGIGVWGQGSPWAGVFAGGVYINGALTVIGAKSAAVPHPDGSLRRLYCVESPESWFEDFGKGSLVNGVACVKLDPDFVAIVNNDDYHVFISPNGESNGLFVDAQTPEGFEVREQKGGASSLTFSYRIVAKRKDIAGPRFENVDAPGFSACEQIKPLDVPPPVQEVKPSSAATGRP
jgi:hypothetical protein